MNSSEIGQADVVVVGAGNAALCAALGARDEGASPIVLETAPEPERGGNTFFVAGSTRWVYNNLDEVREVLDLSEEEMRTVDFGTYTREDYFEDMGRVTQYRCDPDLTEILVDNARPTLVWMKGKGIRFEPMYKGQSQKVDGRVKFFGGQICNFWGGGPELTAGLFRAVEKAGIPVLYETTAIALIYEKGRVNGVVVESGGERGEIRSRAVVLACGGFESSAEMRARYLGPGYELAKVRGTQHNNGAGIRMALEIGAMSAGHWSGAHAVGWDRNAPAFGDREVGDGFQKHSYIFSIMVNARGERFVDEGADFRNFTYAKYGHVVQQQPGMFAWQVFDRKVEHLLRDEYRIRRVTRAVADSLGELAGKMEGVDPKGFLATVAEYNQAVRQDVPFSPVIKDGRGTVGLRIPKSNWANTIDTPPFQAYAVTCGVTFTFGGVKISPGTSVQNVGGRDIPGLYAAGEMIGGLFYFNYPSGSGLVAGAVFGRRAGASAARHALGRS
ncbi:MAG: FAD-dependent tricarballylate dehydrogenase TcuA [Burkholderiales bacterium]|nr:FAD-dependent tricarballylate dehydrogenase TcuA [Burkholderiales bacterium]